MAARLHLATKWGKELALLADEAEVISQEYEEQLRRIGAGMAIVTVRAETTIDPSEVADAKKLLANMFELSTLSADSLDQLDGLVEVIKGNMGITKQARPHLRRIAKSLERILTTKSMFRDWSDNLARAVQGNTNSSEHELETGDSHRIHGTP